MKNKKLIGFTCFTRGFCKEFLHPSFSLILSKKEDTNMEAALNKIQAEYNLSEREKRLLQFSFLGILYDLSKFVMFLIFFACIHQIPAFLFNVLILILLRTNQGGLHLKHYLSCFVFSFLYLFLAICILPAVIAISLTAGLCILFVCMVINYIAGPQKNKKIYSDLKDPYNVKKSKINSFIICLIYMILFFIFSNTNLMQQGLWIIVFHTIQIVITILKKYRKGDF